MDWERFGQAFSGGANVLAGGLMDKYQRQKDIEDYERKRKIESGIQLGEREAEHTFQIGKQTREAWLESIKSDFKTNPELVPFALRAEQGDEEAQKVLSIYAGARHQMDQRTPLSSDQISELAGLPPQTRHAIISRHLTTLNEEIKRKADLEGVLARTAREKATTKKAEEDMKDYSGLYGDYAIEKKARDKAAVEKKKAIDSTQKEIVSLGSKINALQARADQRATSKNQAGLAALDAELTQLKTFKQEAESRLHALTGADVASSASEQARQKWAAESAVGGSPPAPPVAVAETAALPPMPKEESYPVGTRRKNRKTGEVQVWDGTQWKPEK